MTSDIKLFASDMDGTFLRDDHSFDRVRFGRILDRLDELGSVFCVASGRQILALEDTFAEFKDRIAFCVENGALVKYKGKILYSNLMGKEAARQLVEILKKNPYQNHDKEVILFSAMNGAFVLDTTDPDFVTQSSFYYKNMQIVHSIDGINDEIIKVCSEFPPDKIRDCETWVNEQAPDFRASTTGFKTIDIMSAGVSKALGLGHLLESLGWTADNLAAFGDQMNDLEMLNYAGRSVAVANAIPEIRATADDVIGDNNTDAVLEEIEKILERQSG